MIVLGFNQGQGRVGACPALYLRIPVHHDISKIAQQFGSTVSTRFESEESRRHVDHRGSRLSLDEFLLSNDVFQKRNVGLHPPNAHFPQCPVHSIQSQRQVGTRGCYFHEQGIVKRRNDSSRLAHGAIESHSKTSRRTIIQNFAVVRSKVLFGILGGHSALNRTTIARNLILSRNRHLLPVQGETLSD